MFLNIAKAGFQAVDITSMELEIFGEEYILSLLNKNVLKVSSYVFVAPFAEVDVKKAVNIIESGKNAVLQAKRVGTKVAMMVPIAQDDIALYSKMQLAYSLANNLNLISDYAKQHDIYVSIEDTPDLRLPICSIGEITFLLDQSYGLSFVYDSCNMVLAHEDPVTYFDTFAERCVHIHLKDIRPSLPNDLFKDLDINGEPMSCTSTGTGIIDFKTLLLHIKESGYDRYLSIEYCDDKNLSRINNLIENRKYFEMLL